MEEYLTVRQMQDLLKVDRITIYRMLSDGRLRGFKIGQQWRFAASEAERLLNGECCLPEPLPETTTGLFPTHCVQSIQNLFSDLSGAGSLTFNVHGEPLTELSGGCAACRAALNTPAGKAQCAADWKRMIAGAEANGGVFTCHAGLSYWVAPVRENGATVAWFAAGMLPAGEAPQQIADWAGKAARTVDGILQERSGLMNRLQRISELTQFS